MALSTNTEERIKEIIHNQDLPEIEKSVTYTLPAGTEIKRLYVRVRGKSLAECKKVFDDIVEREK